MRGRPSVVGLIAVAAIALAGLLAVAPASGQIAIPLPGEDSKPKVFQKKQVFRPTAPNRNPNRATASITADAMPASNSTAAVEAASAAGATSSASAAVEMTAPPKPSTSSGPAATAALPQDNDTSGVPAKDEESAPQTEAAEESPSADVEPSPETADASPSQEAGTSEPEETEQASEPEDTEPSSETAADSATESAGQPAAAPEESSPGDVASATNETGDAEQADIQEEADQNDASADAAQPEDAAPAEPVETATAEIAPVAPGDTEAAEAAETEDAEQADEPAETTEAPSYDATVVLEVSPPPDEMMVASVAASEAETPTSDEAPTDVAALTPPSEPAPNLTPQSDETPAAAETGTEPEDAGSMESEAEPADAGKSSAATEAAEPAEASETPSNESADVSEDGNQTAAPSESVPEPEVHPAHPLVAAVRAKLAGPDSGKGVAAADLEALRAFYDAREGPPLWIADEGFIPKAQALIDEIGKAEEWGLNAAAFEVPPANDLLATPNAHADDELHLSIAVLKYARQAQAGRLTPKQASILFDQNPPLRGPKAVLTEIAAADDPSAYLLSLHPQHGQFKRLRAALQKARERASGTNPNNDRDVQRILINMERWRWMPRNLGAIYVWNNVPEFEARVVKNGKVIYEEKTVVGQVKYATPFFSAPMRSIVFHPDWTVPPTIVKEDLAPKLQSGGGGFFGTGNSQFLRRHGLKVSLAGEPIDADRVDWRNENVHRYTFTQDPGPANVLGKLKFNFPNRHAIYMHDTVQPELFAERQRTLSHGCIRVQDPDRFAALLLAEDKGWSAGQVQRLLGDNETVSVALNRLVPVHLTYFTATVDESGNLRTFDDVYGIDNRMAAKMFKNPVKFPVPATPEILEASSRARDQGRPPPGGLDSLISGLFGN